MFSHSHSHGGAPCHGHGHGGPSPSSSNGQAGGLGGPREPSFSAPAHTSIMVQPGSEKESPASIDPTKLGDATTSDLIGMGRFDVIAERARSNRAVLAERDSLGRTPLHWTALNNQLDATRELISLGAEVDARAANLQTPLMWAATKGHLRMCRMLLGAGADPNATDNLGATPLIIAAQFNQAFAVLLLARGGAHVDVADSKGCTAVHWAAHFGNVKVLAVLRDLGADFNHKDHVGMTPMHRAVEGDKLDSLRYLKEECNASMRTVDTRGETPGDLAFRMNNMAAHRLVTTPRQGTMASGKAAGMVRYKYLPVAFYLSSVFLTLYAYYTWLMYVPYDENGIFHLVLQILFPLTVVSYVYLVRLDPGFLPVRTGSRNVMESMLRALDNPAAKEPSMDAVCIYCNIARPIRSKHCFVCNRCVQRYDHHCPWLLSCVGQKNHRFFVFMSGLELLVHIFYIPVLFNAMRPISPPFYPPHRFFPGLFMASPLGGYLCVLHIAVLVWIFFVHGGQWVLLRRNMTMSEMMYYTKLDYFWRDQRHPETGKMQQVFSNPFDRGFLDNCKEFFGCLPPGDWMRLSTTLTPLEMLIEV